MLPQLAQDNFDISDSVIAGGVIIRVRGGVKLVLRFKLGLESNLHNPSNLLNRNPSQHPNPKLV
jgi:hypothetical protein